VVWRRGVFVKHPLQLETGRGKGSWMSRGGSGRDAGFRWMKDNEYGGWRKKKMSG